ncbi:hypothetical protein EYR41_008163 [Orbilia oligospora]|uniref:Uncharacterized protein n=1 Tax=Orbilia oligospora TaxID=2813651 RepID=A0A7C8P2F9_ORBOL|nr:hypothetical protein TWF751_005359 [Orbilia oligospora]TGJ66540.1 hypothetical protein EYR41_008163 [Orbilia oligospora]
MLMLKILFWFNAGSGSQPGGPKSTSASHGANGNYGFPSTDGWLTEPRLLPTPLAFSSCSIWTSAQECAMQGQAQGGRGFLLNQARIGIDTSSCLRKAKKRKVNADGKERKKERKEERG